MSVSIYLKGDYEDFHACQAAKNKANPSTLLRTSLSSFIVQRTADGFPLSRE
jgi:hypothetical protein